MPPPPLHMPPPPLHMPPPQLQMHAPMAGDGALRVGEVDAQNASTGLQLIEQREQLLTEMLRVETARGAHTHDARGALPVPGCQQMPAGLVFHLPVAPTSAS
eukprot:2035134-Prymnesium_polylepis.1